jgi:cobaltochelatase CobS
MLTCKLCGHKALNLVPHIEAHTDLGDDPLVQYMTRFDASEEDVVHPILTKKTTKSKSKEAEKPVASDKLIIAGVEVPKGEGGPYVPSVNPAHFFGSNAADVVSDIIENRKIMLVGHTGTGKTSMVTQIAARANQGVFRVNMNAQTTIGDFVGLWTVKGGETVWIDGALPYAMRHGLWLIVDELDFAEPAILSVLNSVLEHNGKLTLKEKGHEIVEPHPNFRIMATANGVGCMSQYRGLYQGTNLMNEAFLDRWRVYHIDYLPPEEEVQVIMASVPRMSVKVASVVVRVGNMIREAFKKEEIACTFSLRRMLDWCELLIRHKNALKAAEPAIFAKVSHEDAEVIRGIITRTMVSQKTTEAR